MTDIIVSPELILQKEALLSKKLSEMQTAEETLRTLFEKRESVSSQLKASIDDPTTSKDFVQKLKKVIATTNTKIEKAQDVMNKTLFEHGQVYEEIRELKKKLNQTDNDSDADEPLTLCGFEIRGVEEFFSRPDILDQVFRMVDPAVLERVMRQA